MKPIFCGNLDYDARQSDLERLFRKYGRVDRVDIKSGFAFIYMDDERDADDAIRGLDRIEFGRKGRRLRVEWTKQERGVRKPGSSKKPSSTARPSKTLFVINFDPYNTRTRDLERHFDPYGKIVNVRIRRNFAFIQYETQEDASRALEATNSSKLLDRLITVEYAIKDDDDKPIGGYSPDKGRGRSSPGRRGGYGRERSASPYRRERGSPDYGHRRSPSPYRKERGSPDYGRGRSSRSPPRRERTNSENGHGRGRSSRSPPRRDRRGSLDDVREPPSPMEEGRISRDRPSPMEEGRISRDRVVEVPSPREEGRITPDYERDRSPSPERRRERASPDDDYRRGGPSPGSKPEPLGEDSPKYGRGSRSPLQERYPSRSPVARERSRSRSPRS